MDESTFLKKLNELLEQNEKPLSIEEASNYLNISKSYLYKLTHFRIIPFYKPFGKRVYFNKAELKEFMLNKKMRSTSELENIANKFIISRKDDNGLPKKKI